MSAPTISQSSSRSKMDTKTMVSLATLTAVAYIVMLLSKLMPSVMFLDFDFKDVVICIGGFPFVPLAAAMISIVVAFIEMITISHTGGWGFLMNMLATASFCCTASFVYKKKHTKGGAVLGLSLGVACLVVVMLLWNYLVTPIYMGYPRETVAAMLPTLFLPFNLVKGGLNMALILLLYKPVVTALRKARLAPERESVQSGDRFDAGFLLFSLALLATSSDLTADLKLDTYYSDVTYAVQTVSREISTYKDWLLVQAGYVFRWFGHEDLGGYIEFSPSKRYAFAPGRRVMWKTGVYYSFGHDFWPDGGWDKADRIRTPFQNRAYEADAAFWPIGVENIAESSLRYCQYGAWFDAEYGGSLGGLDFDLEPFRIAHLIRYLAEYTRRPQMEFLVKLGFHQVVSDLVMRGKPHKDILGWSAGNPADFFRLSKGDFRLFRESWCDFEELKGFRALRRENRGTSSLFRGGVRPAVGGLGEKLLPCAQGSGPGTCQLGAGGAVSEVL